MTVFWLQLAPVNCVGCDAAHGPASEYAYQTFPLQPVLQVCPWLAQISVHVYVLSATAKHP